MHTQTEAGRSPRAGTDRSRQIEALAREVALALKDRQRLPMFRRLCARHNETLIRKVLSEVNTIPESKIRKSKAALFVYLLKKHAHEID
jgi:hypothetical protein